MFRSPTSLNLLAVVALMTGCAGEESATYDLLPTDSGKISHVQDGQLATTKQQIASLGFSTYLGFAGDEYGNAIAVDTAGNSYIAGTTTSFNGTTNVFIAKMSPTGTNLYFTYLPGTQARGIAVDSTGNAYVVGILSGGPTVLKINAAGTSIVYSATLGWNEISAIQIDTSGNAYVTGSVNNGVAGVDVAVGKINPTGTGFLYALAFGGTGTDRGNGIAIDRSGNAYITGNTDSTNFPLATAFQTVLKGPQDAFVTKLNATGSALSYSTYLGGNTYDYGNAIAVDTSGNAYVTGSTASLNGVQSFPVTTGTVQFNPGGGGDAFAAKFGTTGSRIYATYIGGNAAESGSSIAVSASGIAYVTGYTSSTNFPTSNLAYQRFAPAEVNAFVVQLTATFNAYTYSTYLGGSSADVGSAIAVNSTGVTYVTGNTFSADFPTTVYLPGGQYDAFVTKFNGP
ncbi:SBBP repeat-containing protein [Stigmatella aurantiaca]|uniref:Cell surface protein n=2 Tax=Stigmatella aurantiaca (strain DW4/3-1) TaxID=378806 RepID=Q08QN1_STIAD|nr:SBBP repeat-containing protein [Stigmatella aurantiaca]EAU62791.1 cell surface protein [Stigmatella aurantiaca DW4/3-1]